MSDAALSRAEPKWQELHDRQLWDQALAGLGGHPLQSALWGDARHLAEGRQSLYLAGYQADQIVVLARVETRKLPYVGRVAWIPRGPVDASATATLPGLQLYLRKCGFMLSASTPWHRVEDKIVVPGCVRTIWIDLTVGEDQLLQNLDSQFRYGARRALREGVSIEQIQSGAVISNFYQLCIKISQTKGFRLPASLALMQQLLARSDPAAPVEARLFVANFEGRLLAGAFVMRAGTHLHYLWGGVDRKHPKLRGGEAVQWAVIEWALAQGCTLYDLEGIDPVNNPGTYQFKKKMGGSEITLPQLQLRPLDWRGRLLEPLLRGKL